MKKWFALGGSVILILAVTIFALRPNQAETTVIESPEPEITAPAPTLEVTPSPTPEPILEKEPEPSANLWDISMEDWGKGETIPAETPASTPALLLPQEDILVQQPSTVEIIKEINSLTDEQRQQIKNDTGMEYGGSTDNEIMAALEASGFTPAEYMDNNPKGPVIVTNTELTLPDEQSAVPVVDSETSYVDPDSKATIPDFEIPDLDTSGTWETKESQGHFKQQPVVDQKPAGDHPIGGESFTDPEEEFSWTTQHHKVDTSKEQVTIESQGGIK